MKATAERLAWLRSYYKAMDALRFEEVADFLDENCTCVFPSGEVISGREPILKTTRRALEALARIRHEVKQAWEEEHELIFELKVTYWRRNGETIVRPGMGVFVLENARVREQRLFVDASGVWG